MKMINVALDVSGSLTESMITSAISSVDFGEYDKINFLQFDTEVEKFVKLNNVSEISTDLRLVGGGTIIQSVVDFIVNNEFDKYKTFIISDFYADEPDYSVLDEYELVKISW